MVSDKRTPAPRLCSTLTLLTNLLLAISFLTSTSRYSLVSNTGSSSAVVEAFASTPIHKRRTRKLRPSLVPPLAMSSVPSSSSSSNKNKVAVIGTTGRLGRQVILQLNQSGTPCKCLIRKPVDVADTAIKPSIDKEASGDQVAAYLAALPNVELVLGDVTNADSLAELVKDCNAVLALHGAGATGLKSLVPVLNPEDGPRHAKQINYVGVQNIIDACIKSETCKRIVRVTGKGEDPYGIFSILINMLGSMAKAWNYEGEQLLRNCKDVDYTIVRPGIMGPPNVPTGKVLALKDNGGDMNVTAVRYEDIASLCVECIDYDNTKRSTLTAMNVEDGEGEETYAPLLAKVKADSREFPETLLGEHKKGARLGATVLVAFMAIITKAVVIPIGKLMMGLLGLK
mmetsp:Transcript_194/g.261  ORF Transcript_194/g.261 Transcript_194/m.261 type:complete len:399 (-) Transcript_194:75-1271(-)